MKVIAAKPSSPGRRFLVKMNKSNLYKGKPFKSLLSKKSGNHSGRNSAGRITVRHRGGSHKRHYRHIDFYRTKDNMIASVVRVEYDPNRTANIALLLYKDGTRKYIIAPNDLYAGMKVMSGIQVEVLPGNCMPMSNIPVGTFIHNLELKPGKGAQVARSAGSSVQIIGKDSSDEGYVKVRLRSGEIRKFLSNCRAVIGVVSNVQHNLLAIGKAGASRWKGIRPTVRGVAMNPVDHPHGGGEGRTSGGRHPVTPWGTQTKGKKTRKNRFSDKLIFKKRK